MLVVTLNGKQINAELDMGSLIALGLVTSDSLRKPTGEELRWIEWLMQPLLLEQSFMVGE